MNNGFWEKLGQEIKEAKLTVKADSIGLKLGQEYSQKEVLLPQNIEQLAAIVKLANQYGMPLYPIGNGSRFTQGVKPFQEGVLVSLKNMTNVIENRPENMSIEVEAGLTVSKIQQILAKSNIYFPIDSNDKSTIGGIIAANGYGRKKYLHKTTRFYVMGMEFVSPQGEVIKVGGRTIKNVSSFDLHQLLAGSWGTFGIITKAILKVKPIPEKIVVLQRLVKDSDELLKLMERVLFQERTNLASLTFEQSGAGFLIQVELEGFTQTLQEQQEMLENKYGFREAEELSDALFTENAIISLSLSEYFKGLSQLLEMQQRFPGFKIRGNTSSGLIYLSLQEEKDIIRNIKDFIDALEGDFIFENMRLTKKDREAGINKLFIEIKKRIDPNNILVPSTRVIKE
jgi:glycolate oxidase